MMRRRLSIILLVLLFSLLLTLPAVADRTTQNLESRIIECWDNPDDPENYEWNSSKWIVRGSKFATKIYDENGEVTQEFPEKAYIESWPNSLFGTNPEDKPLKVLGIHGRFDRKGYNYIEIIPAVENQEGELVPRQPDMTDDEGKVILGNEITLPGRTQNIDLWVWGSNYDYYLDIHVRDYKGIVHTLRTGSVKYTGWKNLQTSIPNYIPQEGGHVTSGGYLKELKLVKLVLWTRPHEDVNDFYIYFDQIKTLTDAFVTRFDGDDLADKQTIQEVWSNGEGE